jgi:hypothetical protein
LAGGIVGAGVGGKRPKLTANVIDAEDAPIWVTLMPVSKIIPLL